MSKRTTIVVHPDGTFDKRTSLNRVYTSVIVRRTDQWQVAEWTEAESIPYHLKAIAEFEEHLKLAQGGHFTERRTSLTDTYTVVYGLIGETDYYLGTPETIASKSDGSVTLALVWAIERSIQVRQMQVDEARKRVIDLKEGPQYKWEAEGWRSDRAKAEDEVRRDNKRARLHGGYTKTSYRYFVENAVVVPDGIKPADYAAQIRTIMENGAAAS